MESKKLFLEAQEWISPIPGMKFKLLNHDGKRVRLVELEPNFVEPGWCARGHCGYVLSGEAELQFEDGRMSLEPGEAFVIPNGESSKHIIHVGPQPYSMLVVDDA